VLGAVLVQFFLIAPALALFVARLADEGVIRA
jgi:hypothetical protein